MTARDAPAKPVHPEPGAQRHSRRVPCSTKASETHSQAKGEPRDRGQAVLEMSLGALLFVTVLLFGIHYAEVTFTQMKVTEAASSTMWDVTAGKMHHWDLVAEHERHRQFGARGGRIVAIALRELRRAADVGDAADDSGADAGADLGRTTCRSSAAWARASTSFRPR